jgi:hypothetical protein
MTTAFLLVLSNVFMAFAWYGHLKFKDKSVWIVIVRANPGGGLFHVQLRQANRTPRFAGCYPERGTGYQLLGGTTEPHGRAMAAQEPGR